MLLRLSIFFTLLVIGCFVGFSSAPLAHAAADKTALDEDIYVSVPAFSVNLFHKSRPKAIMTVRLKLYITDRKVRQQALKVMPKLQSNFLSVTYQIAHSYLDAYKPVDATRLGRAYNQVAYKLLDIKEDIVLIEHIFVNRK